MANRIIKTISRNILIYFYLLLINFKVEILLFNIKSFRFSLWKSLVSFK